MKTGWPVGMHPLECLEDAHLLEPPLQVRHGLLVLEIGHVHRLLRFLAGHPESVTAGNDLEGRLEHIVPLGYDQILFGFAFGLPRCGRVAPQGLEQGARAQPRRPGDEMCAFRQFPRQGVKAFPVLRNVRLVEGILARSFRKGGTVLLQFLFENLNGLQRVRIAQVHQEQQYPGAFDVPQEIMAKALAFGSALDDAGDVRHSQHAVVRKPRHAQVRRQRGEGIVPDLGFRRADHREQGGLARVRQSDQPDFRDQFQFQQVFPFFARFALSAKCGARFCSGETRVAPPPGRPALPERFVRPRPGRPAPRRCGNHG